MKNYSFLLIIFLLPWFNSPQENESLIVNHDIEAITVYLNSAEISRKGKIVIPEGKTDLIFKGISNRIMGQGLKVTMSGGVKVYAVHVETNTAALDVTKEDQELKDKLRVLEKARTVHIDELSVLDKELKYWEMNMKIGGSNGVSYAELESGAKFFTDKIRDLKIRQNEAYINKDESDLQILELKKSLKVFEEKAEAINHVIRVTVISDKVVDTDIDLRYLVSNAIWKPYYSLRAKDKDEPITLEYQAQIYNDTGNDWNNKPITLAIMDPSQDVSKPNMDAWVLDNGVSAYMGEGLLNDSKGRYKKTDSRTNETEVLQIDDLSTRFEIKNQHLIPSDATPHLIDVKTYTKEADYYTLSIPKVKDGAFLIARIKDWESLGLLDGPINLYYNDSYQGVSQLDTRQISDTLDISLGKENSYTITRRKESSMSSEKLIGFNIKEVLTYEIIVKNNKNKTAEIEVRDQLPLSTDKDVEVKPLVVSGAKLDALSGQLTWNVKLAAKESKKIILKFSVKYPKSKRGLLKQNKNRIITPRYF